MRQRKAVTNGPALKRPSAKKDSMAPRISINKAVIVFFAVVVVVVATQFHRAWRVSRVYQPFPQPMVVEQIRDEQDVNEKLWGTYRSHLYFGMRTRTPDSLLFGLLWYSRYMHEQQVNVRYTCEQSDNLERYGWLAHDGRYFGRQEIVESDFIMTTTFLKRPMKALGGDWSARISGVARNSKASRKVVSLMFAVSNEGEGELKKGLLKTNMADRQNDQINLYGWTPATGSFKVMFKSDDSKNLLKSFLSVYEKDIYDVRGIVQKHLGYREEQNEGEPLISLAGDVANPENIPPNVFIFQVTMRLPFTLEVIFECQNSVESTSPHGHHTHLSGSVFDTELKQREWSFDQKFEQVFQLEAKGFSEDQITFAKAAMSNMLGGMGYFYGRSLIKSPELKEPVPYWPAALYTGVPSRSFFPRGFLWDEGFHQLMLQHWDASVTRDSIAHWLDKLNYYGWIPREQILGVEARRKVPEEFVVQNNVNANPPTFFLTIQSLIDKERQSDGKLSAVTMKFLRAVFPRLQVWFNWYNTTQVGSTAGTYRWHGRDARTDRELNPKTLTSGLDDYPRASHPTDDERHVDLRCWIAVAAGIMADIADTLGSRSEKYRETADYLSDNDLLDELHWSTKLNAYADFGNHTKFAALDWVSSKQQPGAPRLLKRVVRSTRGPTLKFVDAFGYVSLFPFLLKLMLPTSPRLRTILDNIRDEERLWTKFGLRSMAKNSPFYNERNTEHDKPYWRGPIWININYLAVKALQYYASVDGPYASRARSIYTELKTNLITNVWSQYRKRGYIFEQYNDETGEGQGCFPFTGWSALIPLIMAEI